MAFAAVATLPPSNSSALALSMPTLNHSSCVLATMVRAGRSTVAHMSAKQYTNDYSGRLESALDDAGKSIHDLADELKVTYQAIKKVLDGKSKMLTADRNVQAARYLNVDSEWLATGKGNRTPTRSTWPLSSDLLAALRTASPQALRQVENAARNVLDLPLLPRWETAAAA